MSDQSNPFDYIVDQFYQLVDYNNAVRDAAADLEQKRQAQASRPNRRQRRAMKASARRRRRKGRSQIKRDFAVARFANPQQPGEVLELSGERLRVLASVGCYSALAPLDLEVSRELLRYAHNACIVEINRAGGEG